MTNHVDSMSSDFGSMLFCLALAISGYILLRPSRQTLKSLPGPPSPSILFGNFLQLVNAESGVLYEKWFAEYGPVIVYRSLFGKLRLSVIDPKALNHILVQHCYEYPKPDAMRGDLKRVLGHGILFAEGEEHKRQKKLLSPTFSPAQLKGLAPLVYRVAQNLSARWTEKIVGNDAPKNEQSIINVLPWLNRATLDIIGEAGFGHLFDGLEKEDQSELALALSKFTNAGGTFEGANKFKVLAISVMRRFPRLLKLLPIKRIKVTEQCLKVMERETKIALARAKHSHEIQDDRKDLLSLLVRANSSILQERDRMSDEEVKGQMTTFLFAGHETTATALTWFLWILAKHPDVQAKLRSELIDATTSGQLLTQESEGLPLSLEEINVLPYLDAFCREGFRFLTPVPTTDRVASHDDKIPLSKPICTTSGEWLDHITVSAGQEIVIPMSAFHYCETIFGPDARMFNPERWMKDERPRSGAGHWAGLLTFLAGPRACLGYRFALVELKILLMVLVMKFKFQERDVGGGPEFEKRTTVVMRPKIRGDQNGPSMPLRVSLV